MGVEIMSRDSDGRALGLTVGDLITELQVMNPSLPLRAVRVNREGECWAYMINSVTVSRDPSKPKSFEGQLNLLAEWAGQDNDEQE